MSMYSKSWHLHGSVHGIGRVGEEKASQKCLKITKEKLTIVNPPAVTGAHLLFTWNQPQRLNQRPLWRNVLLSCSDSLLSQPTFRLPSYCFLISGTRWCPTGAGTTARCAVTDCLNVSAGRQRGCPSLGRCYWSRWIMCLCPKSLLKTVFSSGAVI